LFFLLLLHYKHGIHTAMVSPAKSTNSDDSDVTAQSEDCARKELLREFTKAVKVAFQSYSTPVKIVLRGIVKKLLMILSTLTVTRR
jgi:hypothetical protein